MSAFPPEIILACTLSFRKKTISRKTQTIYNERGQKYRLIAKSGGQQPFSVEDHRLNIQALQVIQSPFQLFNSAVVDRKQLTKGPSCCYELNACVSPTEVLTLHVMVVRGSCGGD